MKDQFINEWKQYVREEYSPEAVQEAGNEEFKLVSLLLISLKKATNTVEELSATHPENEEYLKIMSLLHRIQEISDTL